MANTLNTFENSDVRTTTIVTEIYTFEPGIMSRWGGHYYKDICGTLRANAGDNQMSVARKEPTDSTPTIKK